MTVLEVEGLSKVFGGIQAVRDVDFRLAAGQLLVEAHDVHIGQVFRPANINRRAN